MDDAEGEFRELLRQRHGIELEAIIGRGGMGIVYRGREVELNRTVAVKLLTADLTSATDTDASSRFRSEMQLLAQVNHSAVVTIYTQGITASGQPFFVMEYIPGTDLRKLINARRAQGVPFSISEAVGLLRPVAAALDYLHFMQDPPIVHRDVKPANILIPEKGKKDVASVLTDFGISLTPEDTRVTELYELVGTEQYFAPELYPGGESGSDGIIHNQPGPSSDNYALGLVAFEMLTLDTFMDTMSPSQWQHQRPAPRVDPGKLTRDDEDLARGLSELFARQLSPAKADRFRKAVDFIDALNALDGLEHSMKSTSNQGPRPGRVSTDAPTRGSWAPDPHSTKVHPVDVPMANPHANQWNTSSAPAMPGRRKKHTGLVIVLIIALVLLLVSAGGAAWYFFKDDSFTGEEKTTAQIFPDLVGDTPGKGGSSGMACQVPESTDDIPGAPVSVLRCADDGIEVDVVRYSTAEDAVNLAPSNDPVEYRSQRCSIAVDLIDYRGGQAYRIIREGTEQAPVLLWGSRAEDMKQKLPVC